MKFYLRVPLVTDEEGSNARILSDSEGVVRIDTEEYHTLDQTAVVKLHNKIYSATSGRENLTIFIPDIVKEDLVWFWLSQNQYKPSDTIKGFLVVRERVTASSSMLKKMNKKGILSIGKRGNKPILSQEIDLHSLVSKFEFEIPETAEEGEYLIQLIDQKNQKEIGNISCPISHYKKKDMDVNISMPLWTEKEDEVPVEVSCLTFGGEPINETVTLEYDNETLEKELANGKAEFLIYPTSGKFVVKIRDKSYPKEIKIVESPVRIRMFLPSAEKIMTNVLLDFSVTIENPINVPYSNISITSVWKRITKLGKQVNYQDHLQVTDENGKCTFETEFELDGMYRWEVYCEIDGVEYSASRNFSVKRSSQNYIQLHHKMTKKEFCEGEKIAGIIYLKGEPSACEKIKHCYIDLVTDRILETRKIQFDNGKAEYELNGVTDFYGTFAVDAYVRPIDFGIATDYHVKKDDSGCIVERKVGYISPSIPFECKMSINNPSSSSTGEEVSIEVSIDSDLVDEHFKIFGVVVDQRVLHHQPDIDLCKTFLKKPSAMEVMVLKSEEIIPITKSIRMSSFGPTFGSRMESRSISYRSFSSSGSGRFTGHPKPAGSPPPPPSKPPSFANAPIYMNEVKALFARKVTQAVEKIRKNFATSILLEPVNIKNKKCVLTFTTPDAISNYAIYLFGIGNTQFAESESEMKIRNPIYMELENVPSIVLNDQIVIPINIYNKSGEKVIGNLEVVSSEGVEVLRLGEEEMLLNNGVTSTYVLIQSTEVGFANIELKLSTQNYVDIVSFDQPLYVRPPNDPFIDYTSDILSSENPSKTITIPENESVHSLLSLSLVPRNSIAVIDGLERLMEYPHGCCEQTTAKLVPNALVYNYLESNNKLTQPLKEKLITNMNGGVEVLMKYNNSDGGFSYWGGESKVFYTSLALSALGKVSKYVNVDPKVIQGAYHYLKSHKKHGKWNADPNYARESIPIKNDYSMTAYVLYSLTESGMWDEESYQWMLKNISHYDNDSILLGIMLYIASKNHKSKEDQKTLFNILKDNSEKKEEGIIWKGENGLVNIPSRRISIESSAYAIIGIAHAFPEEVELIDESLKPLFSQRCVSTRDALMVINAILCGKSNSEVDCTISVYHNDVIIKRETISQKNMWWKSANLSKIDVEVKEGDKIKVEMEGSGLWSLKSEFKKWYFEKEVENEIDVKRTIIENGGNPILEIELNAENVQNGILLEQNIPPMFHFGLNNTIIPDSNGDQFFVKNNKISVHIPSFEKKKVIKIPLQYARKGKCLIERTKIYGMYNPVFNFSQSDYIEL